MKNYIIAYLIGMFLFASAVTAFSQVDGKKIYVKVKKVKRTNINICK